MKTQILEAINNADESQLVELNNVYCHAIGDSDNEIFSNDEEFFELFFPNAGDGLTVAQKIHFGDYNYSHNYVTFDGYANFKTFRYVGVEDLCEFPETMAEYIEENFEEFNHLDMFSDIEVE